MTTEDKILTMETIWEDLCKKAECIPFPAWHKDILEERERAKENGKENFIDWSEAKRQIEDKISWRGKEMGSHLDLRKARQVGFRSSTQPNAVS